MHDLNHTIGERVRNLRFERNWTQAKLAALLGISQGYLSQIERGRGAFTAAQLLLILQKFNVPVDYFSSTRPDPDAQIQNALARQGATHLVESDILPSEKLRNATTSIREALISADSSRQITAIAPVIVENIGQINLSRLRSEFAELGLENRLYWAIESTREAIRRESNELLSREWRLKYRRAELIIANHFAAQFVSGLSPTPDPDKPAAFDILDPEISSRESVEEIKENLSEIARRWRILTRLEVDDFVRALRSARGIN